MLPSIKFLLVASLFAYITNRASGRIEYKNASHAIASSILDRTINLAAILTRLDVPRLSLILALQYQYSDPQPNVFSLERTWRTTPNASLLRRFLVYGNYLVYKKVAGDGSCFYHALALSLQEGGFTVGRILDNLDHNGKHNRAVYEAMRRLENPYRFFEMMELKRIAVVGYLEVDPFIDVSYDLWDYNKIIDKLLHSRAILEQSADTALDIAKDLRFPSIEKIDYYIGGLMISESRRQTAFELFQQLLERANAVWGDSVDLHALELALNFKILQINHTTGCINCAYWSTDFVPKSVALLHYNDQVHYDTAGIVNLNDVDIVRSTRGVALSSFPVHEMPMALALMVANDCRFQSNTQEAMRQHGEIFID